MVRTINDMKSANYFWEKARLGGRFLLSGFSHAQMVMVARRIDPDWDDLQGHTFPVRFPHPISYAGMIDEARLAQDGALVVDTDTVLQTLEVALYQYQPKTLLFLHHVPSTFWVTRTSWVTRNKIWQQQAEAAAKIVTRFDIDDEDCFWLEKLPWVLENPTDRGCLTAAANVSLLNTALPNPTGQWIVRARRGSRGAWTDANDETTETAYNSRKEAMAAINRYKSEPPRALNGLIEMHTPDGRHFAWRSRMVRSKGHQHTFRWTPMREFYPLRDNPETNPKGIPKTVERYYQETKRQSPHYTPAQAWAVAWSRYCKYKRPNSPRCHQKEYFAKKNPVGKAPKVPPGSVLHMSAIGNPDFYEPHDIGVPAEKTKVSSWQQASKAARRYIEEHGLGGGNWSGGQIMRGKTQMAYVSYNGRVWKGEALIYDPLLTNPMSDFEEAEQLRSNFLVLIDGMRYGDPTGLQTRCLQMILDDMGTDEMGFGWSLREDEQGRVVVSRLPYDDESATQDEPGFDELMTEVLKDIEHQILHASFPQLRHYWSSCFDSDWNDLGP